MWASYAKAKNEIRIEYTSHSAFGAKIYPPIVDIIKQGDTITVTKYDDNHFALWRGSGIYLISIDEVELTKLITDK